MKLYWYWSFNPQKVRLALEELDLDYELVTVDLFTGEHRSADFGKLHPRNRVPVLEDGDVHLWESNAMLVYLGEKCGHLWPQNAAGKADAMRWLFFESRHLSDPVGRIWFNDFALAQIGREGNMATRDAAAESLPDELKVVETHLASHDYFLGTELSLTDCCYGPVLDALSLSNFDLEGWPAISAYLKRMRERAAWDACEFRS